MTRKGGAATNQDKLVGLIDREIDGEEAVDGEMLDDISPYTIDFTKMKRVAQEPVVNSPKSCDKLNTLGVIYLRAQRL